MPQVQLISPITHQEVRKTRVAAYCRVSTNSADQQNSYSRQIGTYTKLIGSRKDWELAEIFADEGISGLSAEKRPDFLRMIRSCEQHQIDLILTKSVSRFARNVKEALEYVRKLKKLGIGVQFEKEGINTLSLGDEMLLNVFSALAQEESKSISQNLRFSIRKLMESGEYVNGCVPYGFRLTGKELVIHEPEAKVVREIFRQYLEGKSLNEIGHWLDEKQISTRNGIPNWNLRVLSRMLTNEKYVGDTLYQKKYRDTTVPFKQHLNHGEEDQFYARDCHRAIIDRDVYDAVQRLFLKQKERFGKNDGTNQYPLTHRIRCSECGAFYIRRIIGGCVKWVCGKHKEDSTACPSNYYSEERLYDGFISMVNNLRFGKPDILGTVIAKLELTDNLYKRNNTQAATISQEIADLNSKKLMLEQLRAKGYLAPEVYESQLREISQQISTQKQKRQDTLDSRIQTMLEDVRRLKDLLWEIEEPLESFNEMLFGEIVKDITLNNRDEMTFTLLGGLKFTERI